VSIAWLEWNDLAFDRAEAEHKPVLLSLTTRWSDGCSVMDGTTYADPAVMSLIDAQFIPVRVDADRRPDLNERYNLGGWPTTAFLTSHGHMLTGATFLNPDEMTNMLRHVAAACRDRAAEISARSVSVSHSADPSQHSVHSPPLIDVVPRFRSLLVERFDAHHGGFGSAPKLPHPGALLFALSVCGESEDAELSQIVDLTLDRMGALWDQAEGGFFRYAEAADWSGASTEKTLEDNAALLHVAVEAAVRGRGQYRDRAASLVQWIKSAMADRSSGGFYNARTPAGVDKAMYVDRNAMMVGAFIRAAALFDDIWLRDFALKSLEAVIVPAYTPGAGVGHAGRDGLAPAVRGLLTDQVHVASALIWAHAATGQLPYSMLALELMQFAVRWMWDVTSDAFRDRVEPDDPVVPFDVNCLAACVLDRLAVLTGDAAHHERARVILRSLHSRFEELDLFGAPYALAVLEVIDRRPPAGLELAPVDWQLSGVKPPA
jgi:uncharacterized protein YyaL (SSP411 family)